LVAKGLSVDTGAAVREPSEFWNASHGGQGGGLGLGRKAFGGQRGFRARTRRILESSARRVTEVAVLCMDFL
jgi:hypothetical protein